jgi:two-component system chemotaxis response regulator CheB
MLENGKIRVHFGPRENRHRPSIDVLFRSAARWYGPRVIAVLLSGMRADGVSGLKAVNRAGGTVLVQQPDEALYPNLPLAGIEMDSPDQILPTDKIAQELVRLSQHPAADHVPTPMDLERELRFANGEAGPKETPPGEPSPYACPDCNGAMWQVQEGQLERYRCRVGHAFSEADLVISKAETLENALWAAMRSLEESASIERRAGARAGRIGQGSGGERLLESAEVKTRQAEVLRRMLTGEKPLRERTGTTE